MEGSTRLDQFKLNAEETVLLIIDIQEKLMPAMERRERVYKNTALLLTAAEQLHIPVVVTEQYPKGLGRTVPEVAGALPEDHRLVEKMTFDAAGAGLMEVLEDLGRRSVLVCGTETHVCVYQTVRSLLAHGFRVFPVRDAVCSRFEENYQSGLGLMARMGSAVVTAETAAFDLLKVSGTPEFKVVSKALK